jgi:hypothetical protein
VERKLRVDSKTRVEMETTEFSMQRDGEPVERGGFGGGQSSSEVRTLSYTDDVLELADGRPTTLRRSFETAQLERVTEVGEDSRADSIDSPLADTVLELTLDDEGDVVASVIEGSEPDDSAWLEGHHLTLAVDALLPPGEVAAGDEWELDGAAILAGLGLDHEIFPPSARPEGGAGGGEDRGGGRGRRVGFGGWGGGSALRMFSMGEWEGKATFTGEESGENGSFGVIELELKSSGDLPEPERGAGGGRRRGGFLSAGSPGTEGLIESSFEIKLEGKLLFSLKDKRPALLEISGTIATERDTERTFNETTMTIHSAQEGEFTHRVEIGAE